MMRALLAFTALPMALGCASAPKSVPLSDGSEGVVEDPGPPVFEAVPVGWASVADLDTPGTTGGAGGPVVTVTTTAELAQQAEGTAPLVILIEGVVGEGTRVSIGSNKTVLGLPGAEFHGGLRINGSSNVIVRNLKIVGNNCADDPEGCSGGADAVSIGDGAHHVWVDHCDISDGSDGNLDVNDGADYVTISWTKFWYSGRRPGGHQFSNLVGSSDNEPGDVGRLRVTYHHVWWADRVQERMPRVRYGQVHIFNSLYTAVGNSYCVGVGHYANILTEANAFYGVQNPIESVSYANDQSVVVSRDNLYIDASGYQSDRGSAVFTPPYVYTLDRVGGLKSLVESGAGVCPSRFTFAVEPVPGCVDTTPAASTTP